METPGGIYSLNDPDAARKNLRSAMELYTPVKGVVTEKFSPIDNRYGTTLATAGNQQVMAVMDGTVVSSSWTPEDGFVLFIQHGGNMLSVYRHNTSVLKRRGNAYRAARSSVTPAAKNPQAADRTCSSSNCGITERRSIRKDTSFFKLF